MQAEFGYLFRFEGARRSFEAIGEGIRSPKELLLRVAVALAVPCIRQRGATDGDRALVAGAHAPRSPAVRQLIARRLESADNQR